MLQTSNNSTFKVDFTEAPPVNQVEPFLGQFSIQSENVKLVDSYSIDGVDFVLYRKPLGQKLCFSYRGLGTLCVAPVSSLSKGEWCDGEILVVNSKDQFSCVTRGQINFERQSNVSFDFTYDGVSEDLEVDLCLSSLERAVTGFLRQKQVLELNDFDLEDCLFVSAVISALQKGAHHLRACFSFGEEQNVDRWKWYLKYLYGKNFLNLLETNGEELAIVKSFFQQVNCTSELARLVNHNFDLIPQSLLNNI